MKEKAYTEIRKMIIGGALNAGQFLTERTLVEMLGMSRTPIRAALERLDMEGLANYTPNKGLIVAEISLQRAVDFFDFRIALESYVVRRLAAKSLLEGDIAWFEDNLLIQNESMEQNDHIRFAEADSQFHRKLAQINENMEIFQAMEQLEDKLHQISLKVLKKDYSRIKTLYKDHLQIFNMIQQGEAEEAGERMIRHLEYAKRFLIS